MDEMHDIGLIIIRFVIFLFSLTLHEFGHAWTSELFGDPTGRYEGRVSLNPLVHIDPLGTVIIPLVGAYFGIPIIGWAKPVPVNPLLWREKVKANIVVSAAGPLANILIAAVSAGLWKVLSYTSPQMLFNDGSVTAIGVFLFSAITINVSLAVFNMIPIPPLDGSHIVSSVLSIISGTLADIYDQLRPYGLILLIILINFGPFNLVVGKITAFIYTLLLF
ncbi:MAG: site-2 protease family protein [Blastocatellia bacterium]|nr:site-2 protease family protein [Blastocatellia bacterium]